MQSQNHATSFLWPQGRTHTLIHTYILHESDSKKLGAHRRLVAGVRLVLKIKNRSICLNLITSTQFLFEKALDCLEVFQLIGI